MHSSNPKTTTMPGFSFIDLVERFLVAYKPKSMKIAGLQLAPQHTDSNKQGCILGEIMSIGAALPNKKNEVSIEDFSKFNIAVGDFIYYQTWSGLKIETEEQNSNLNNHSTEDVQSYEYHIVKPADILGIVHKGNVDSFHKFIQGVKI